MSTKKNTTKSTSTKPAREHGPTEFFPKRGKRGTSKVSIPMIGGAGSKQQVAKEAAKAAAKAKTPAKPTTSKRGMSGLDAAAMVLAEARKPMTTQQMVESMTKRGLWKTSGKTPAATIYAAIFREIKAKGRASRFWKASRGKFTRRPARQGSEITMIAPVPNRAADRDDDLVPPQDACPLCGERRQDRLVWIDDERVRCANCNAVYNPGDGQHDA